MKPDTLKNFVKERMKITRKENILKSNLRKMGIPIIIFCIINSLFLFVNASSSIDLEILPIYSYRVINTYPHDSNAFTQGLVFENGFLYEGTGLYRSSSLRRVELETGTILQISPLPDKYFGEGITIFENKIIQLTWKSNIGFVYERNTFNKLNNFKYSFEGWGITHDGKRLIISDGTSIIHFLDPNTFKEIGQIKVFENNTPVNKINELEYVKGEIYANIWQTNRIARIDPRSGRIIGWIDLTGILEETNDAEEVDVLNGIAYDAVHDRLFVTGKLWPYIFEIQLIKN